MERTDSRETRDNNENRRLSTSEIGAIGEL